MYTQSSPFDLSLNSHRPSINDNEEKDFGCLFHWIEFRARREKTSICWHFQSKDFYLFCIRTNLQRNIVERKGEERKLYHWQFTGNGCAICIVIKDISSFDDQAIESARVIEDFRCVNNSSEGFFWWISFNLFRNVRLRSKRKGKERRWSFSCECLANYFAAKMPSYTINWLRKPPFGLTHERRRFT